MTDRPPRLRFAPSPTGFFHVGSGRSALFNWALAEQQGGTFVLRIEDTDAERNREEWTEGILDALAWLGISRDDPRFEGPYFQSHYAERAPGRRPPAPRPGRRVLLRLHPGGARRRATTAPAGRATTASAAIAASSPAEGRALRFRVPRPGRTVVVDLIRGTPTFDHDAIEDFVILRGNGTPMFLLANVVDDMAMDVTHVVRGEEHLPNTPKQQLLWAALGRPEPPVWAHVPVLVNEKRQKLSKRRDKVALEQYRDEGYLAAAMRNYLMTLGWAPSGDERDRAVVAHRGRVPARGRRAVARVLRREEAPRLQRRVHPGAPDRGVHRGLPAVADRPERALAGRRATTRPCSPRWPRSCRPG